MVFAAPVATRPEAADPPDLGNFPNLDDDGGSTGLAALSLRRRAAPSHHVPFPTVRRVRLSPPSTWVMYEDGALPPLTAGDIFALERLKAAGMNQLSKGT